MIPVGRTLALTATLCAWPAALGDIRVYVANQFPEKLIPVKATLELLGYTDASTFADANLIWSWQWPFSHYWASTAHSNPKLAAVYSYLPRLQPHQAVNHLRGVQAMAQREFHQAVIRAQVLATQLLAATGVPEMAGLHANT